MKILATKVQFVNSQYIRLTALVFVLLLCATAPRYARAAEIADLVIQNFHIIEAGASADTETETASLKVTDNKLVLVSKDAIPTDDDAKTYDAAGGYLLGNLVVGEVPNFIILTRNPAVHMDVLLDTKPHISFAVDKGELARNSLVQIHETPGGDSVRRRPLYHAVHGREGHGSRAGARASRDAGATHLTLNAPDSEIGSERRAALSRAESPNPRPPRAATRRRALQAPAVTHPPPGSSGSAVG